MGVKFSNTDVLQCNYMHMLNAHKLVVISKKTNLNVSVKISNYNCIAYYEHKTIHSVLGLLVFN